MNPVYLFQKYMLYVLIHVSRKYVPFPCSAITTILIPWPFRPSRTTATPFTRQRQQTFHPVTARFLQTAILSSAASVTQPIPFLLLLGELLESLPLPLSFLTSRKRFLTFLFAGRFTFLTRNAPFTFTLALSFTISVAGVAFILVAAFVVGSGSRSEIWRTLKITTVNFWFYVICF